MALAIDASTPAVASSTGGITSIASNSFSPPAGSLIAVLFSGAASTGSDVSITDSLGTHLTWTKVADEGGGTDARGRAAIWFAKPATAPGSMTVTISWTFNTTDNAVLPVVVTGQAATQNGGSTTNFSNSGLPTGSFTTVGANSLILGTFWNNTDGTGPTVPAGQTTTINGHSSVFSDVVNGSASWMQYQTGMNLASSVTATLNDTAPTVEFVMASCEILAGAAAPATPNLPVVNWPQAMWRSAYR